MNVFIRNNKQQTKFKKSTLYLPPVKKLEKCLKVFDHDDLRLSPAKKEKIINTCFNDALNCKLITLPVELAKLKEALLTYSSTSFFLLKTYMSEGKHCLSTAEKVLNTHRILRLKYIK